MAHPARGLPRAGRTCPLLLKLPPFTNDDERAAGPRRSPASAVDAGARGLDVLEHRPGPGPAALDRSRRPLGRACSGADAADRARTWPPRPAARSRSLRAEASPRPRTCVACLDAGATTVQLYTGLIYRGPGDRRASSREGCRHLLGPRRRTTHRLSVRHCGTLASPSRLAGFTTLPGAGEGERRVSEAVRVDEPCVPTRRRFRACRRARGRGQAVRGRRRGGRRRAWTCARGSSSRCSGRPAPARPPASG